MKKAVYLLTGNSGLTNIIKRFMMSNKDCVFLFSLVLRKSLAYRRIAYSRATWSKTGKPNMNIINNANDVRLALFFLFKADCFDAAPCTLTKPFRNYRIIKKGIL